MSDEIDQFLTQKGTIELICELGRDGARFSELESSLWVSQDTFLRRLKRGQELSLFGKELVETDHGTSHKYVLTGDGVLVWMLIERTNLTEAYHVYKDSRRRFERKSDEAREVVSEQYGKWDDSIDIPDEPQTLDQYLSNQGERRS